MTHTDVARNELASTTTTPRGMSHAELLALPVMVPLRTANRALQLGRTTGFLLAKNNEYPVRVHRMGNQYRVTRADLLRFLGVEVTATPERNDEA